MFSFVFGVLVVVAYVLVVAGIYLIFAKIINKIAPKNKDSTDHAVKEGIKRVVDFGAEEIARRTDEMMRKAGKK